MLAPPRLFQDRAARIACDGIVLAVNEAMIGRPRLANQDCYGLGWMLLARPDEPTVLATLTASLAIAPAYEAWMQAEGFPGCG